MLSSLMQTMLLFGSLLTIPLMLYFTAKRWFQGRSLQPSLAADNWTEGLLSLSVTNQALVAYVLSNPPQFYYRLEGSDIDTKGKTKQNKIISYSGMKTSMCSYMVLNQTIQIQGFSFLQTCLLSSSNWGRMVI